MHPKWIAIICAAGLALCVIYLWSNWMGDNNEREVKNLCERLDATFVSDPDWMCIKDGEIVYP